MKFRSVIKQITSDKLDVAFDILNLFFDKVAEIKKELILIQSSHSELNKQERLTLLETDILDVKKNKIRSSIIDIVSELESIIEEQNEIQEDTTDLSTQSQTIQETVQQIVRDKGFQIVAEMQSDQSSYYFKAKKNSLVRADYYVIQVLNRYKLNVLQSEYNQNHLDFFSRCSYPFVDLIEFHSGNLSQPSYIIRKYVNGITLNELLQSGVKLSLLQALETIISISKGLKELEKNQIFYNNLIPDQIILGADWKIHILPLNIFEERPNAITWKDLKDGIKFMSPEQLTLADENSAQDSLTTTSNQFSLGLLLFYILMGELVFDGKGLTGLYKDRLDDEDTQTQLKDFYRSFYSKIIQYGIEENLANAFLERFKEIFNTLIEKDVYKRYQEFEDFISKMEYLKLQIEHEKEPYEEQIFKVANSFNQSVKSNDTLLEAFYQKMSTYLPFKKSMDKEHNRNLKLLYALDYLFKSIVRLDNEEHLKEALSCLVKHLHYDFTIDEFEIFFTLLKELVSENDADWNDSIEEAWNSYIEYTLNAIDTILQPIKNTVLHE